MKIVLKNYWKDKNMIRNIYVWQNMKVIFKVLIRPLQLAIKLITMQN